MLFFGLFAAVNVQLEGSIEVFFSYDRDDLLTTLPEASSCRGQLELGLSALYEKIITSVDEI
jgi:hypothetical protein